MNKSTRSLGSGLEEAGKAWGQGKAWHKAWGPKLGVLQSLGSGLAILGPKLAKLGVRSKAWGQVLQSCICKANGISLNLGMIKKSHHEQIQKLPSRKAWKAWGQVLQSCIYKSNGISLKLGMIKKVTP